MNPFEVKCKPVGDYIMNWKMMYPKPYNKKTVTPFTKTRVILMNGTEFESQWFLHQFARHCTDPDLKREIAVIRNQEQQQQKRISALKPLDENFLETTISYEQLAIELTAILAKNEPNKDNRDALDLALLEDFDHLYRFANLLKMDYGISAETLVGKLTEIMPARPTMNEHRHPRDFIKRHLVAKTADPYSKLVANIITGAEQQTMNFYMNIAAQYPNDTGRKLYSEIAMVEEMHVSQYESLIDPTCTWLENWLMHEYTECFLYYSCMENETDAAIKEIWRGHFEMECAHLKRVAELLKKYENKNAKDVIPNGAFPKLLAFGENNIEYVRKVLTEQLWITSDRENYIDARKMKRDADYHVFNETVNGDRKDTPSHDIIVKSIKAFGGMDYRYETKPNPIKELTDRKTDSITAGRC